LLRTLTPACSRHATPRLLPAPQSVTVFSNYVEDSKGEGAAYDIAVIQLAEPIGDKTGWLGYRAQCTQPSPGPLKLTLAGYPNDAGPAGMGSPGGCLADTCTVDYSCGAIFNNHTCDSYVGQSGSGLYDDAYYVRMVHTLGVYQGQSQNGGITMTPFMVGNIASW
jgi:V8-like Glu-specific endopeptidase